MSLTIMNFVTSSGCIVFCMLLLTSLPSRVEGFTRHYEFHVQYQNVTRLCITKSVATVNGQFPGPTIYVREGDRVLVEVTNELNDKNITIHWHGVRQLRTGWSDGPAYITQCPIQPGHTYTYNFTITGQRGTLFWHAHISWLRATVYGALVILPKKGISYPFNQPIKEVPVIIGEWWNTDVEKVIKQALQSGTTPNLSDAYTINGLPGALYNCWAQESFSLPVVSNQTYLLRIINAGLNGELFFTIANHKMTVVEIDAVYTKTQQTDVLLITPGQTTNVLVTANQPIGRYYMAARPYKSANASLDNSTTTGIVEYIGSSKSDRPLLPQLPALNDTNLATNFSNSLRSLDSKEYPTKVPKQIDRQLFFTVGLARKACQRGKLCQGGGKLAASVNNISFVLPRTALLQAHFFNISGVFTADFPDKPPSHFNYTGPQPSNLQPLTGTRLSRVPFGSEVQLILQDTSILGIENHPIHIHGYNFFIVGQGFGNYNPLTHPNSFNLLDPPERNTVAVPAGGWAALRFRADNPGVWFLHCHLDVHNSWGLDMAFLVENGPRPRQSLLPPPPDLPSC
eukprot:c28805_g1_i1 orf=439-2145(-)